MARVDDMLGYINARWPFPGALSDEELETLRPLLSDNPHMAERRLLATVDQLKRYVKYLRVVKS